MASSRPSEPFLLSKRRWEIFIFGCVLAAYSRAFLVNYAMSDDYAFLDTLQSGHGIWIDHLQNGRPLYGLVLQLLFLAAHGLNGLRYVRLIGIVSLSFASILTFRILRSASASSALSAAAALVLAAIPASQVYAGWATASPFPLAVVLAGLAWSVQRSGSSIRILLSLALLLAAFCIHQAAAMTFCGFWVADRFARQFDAPLVEDLRALGILCFGALLNVVVIHVGAGLLHVAPGSRTSLAALDPHKAMWFVREVLPNALGVFSVHPSWGWWLFAVLSLVCACALLPRGRRLRAGGFLLLLLPLSYAPNLIAHESYASYRTLAGLSFVIAVSCLFGWAGVLHRLRPGLTEPLLVVLGVAALAFAGHQVVRSLIRPQVLEYRSMRAQLEPAQPRQRICLIPARLQDAYGVVRYDEFARPSTFAEWSRAAAVRVVLRQLGKPAEGTVIDPAPCDPKAALTVNLRRS